MSTDPRPGFVGLIFTFVSISELNELLKFGVGLLTLAYLVRQHLAFRSEKKGTK